MKSAQTKPAVSKILIVDDHAETRRLTKFFLKDLPFDFEECEDGLEAIDCYEKTRPDWVLMDWEMRRMNGLEATRRIVGEHPQAQILIVTQHDDEELKAAAHKAGARGLILKENLLDLRQLLILH